MRRRRQRGIQAGAFASSSCRLQGYPRNEPLSTAMLGPSFVSLPRSLSPLQCCCAPFFLHLLAEFDKLCGQQWAAAVIRCLCDPL
jgi:hypothetical protein